MFFVDPACTEIVQRGFSLVLMRVFDLSDVHFHMDFNKDVENCHRPFTFRGRQSARMVEKLLARD